MTCRIQSTSVPWKTFSEDGTKLSPRLKYQIHENLNRSPVTSQIQQNPHIDNLKRQLFEKERILQMTIDEFNSLQTKYDEDLLEFIDFIVKNLEIKKVNDALKNIYDGLFKEIL